MHPALMYWWKARQAGNDCGSSGAEAGCGPGAGGGGSGNGWQHRGHGGRDRQPDHEASYAGRHGHGPGHGPVGGGSPGGDDDFGAGAFGVRRPLRFLAYKLELDEKQVAEFARILDELKTERAQAEVDRRRTMSAFADAVAGETFDEPKAKDGAELRVSSAQRLRDAVTKALGRIHGVLDNEQRAQLAYLIRTGTLQL
jgi:Spy/CpxP family protein refolding chaperone